MAPRPNLTGFDIRKLAASSGPVAKDPWARTYVTFILVPYQIAVTDSIVLVESNGDIQDLSRGSIDSKELFPVWA